MCKAVQSCASSIFCTWRSRKVHIWNFMGPHVAVSIVVIVCIYSPSDKRMRSLPDTDWGRCWVCGCRRIGKRCAGTSEFFTNIEEICLNSFRQSDIPQLLPLHRSTINSIESIVYFVVSGLRVVKHMPDRYTLTASRLGCKRRQPGIQSNFQCLRLPWRQTSRFIPRADSSLSRLPCPAGRIT